MITIKTKKDIQAMREGGRILAFILSELKQMVEPGINLLDLEKKAEELIQKNKAEPSFKGYRDYPAILCTSIDEEVVHCPPRDYKLKDGEILSIDCGIKYKKLYTDSAITVPVGNISLEAKKLLLITEEVLHKAINILKPGITIGDIGYTIQNYIESQNHFVVKSLVGHGVGYAVHEDPRIPNYGKPGQGEVLKSGMTICIEPMVNIGGSEVEFAADGWRVTTKDKSLSAHFEHTILIKDDGAEIITKL